MYAKLVPNLMAEATAEITAASGSAPAITDTHIESIDRLSEDLGLKMEKVSESLYVARDMEEDGQKFDYWMFCKYGSKHTGQTISAVVTK